MERYGGPDVLRFVDLADRAAGPGEVVVEDSLKLKRGETILIRGCRRVAGFAIQLAKLGARACRAWPAPPTSTTSAASMPAR